MTQAKRSRKWIGFLILILIVAGFILGIRGCLSQFDTRFAMPPVLHFDINGQSVVFSIVQYQKTTSYSSKGGVTHRSINAEYHIQCNDASTGTKINAKEVAEHSDLDQYPVEVLGAANNKAWVFIDGLIAFDPLTLERTADINTIQNLNAGLKNKMPAERTYYSFDPASGNIMITAIDGSKWMLNTKTLIANELEEENTNDIASLIKELQVMKDKYHEEYSSLHSGPGKLYAEKKIGRDEYTKLLNEANEKGRLLRHKQDSIDDLIDRLEGKEDAERWLRSDIESLSRTGIGFAQMKTNADTFNGKWFGVYSAKEFENLPGDIRYQSEHDETSRRKLYAGTYGPSQRGLMIDKAGVKNIAGEAFLHGGFLLDKTTARPVRPDNNSFLVIHRDVIGREGNIILNRVSHNGKTLWTCNTNLGEWMDWIYTGKRLIIMGRDHEDLSGHECNVMLSINLATGQMVKYDYMEDM